MLAGVGGHVVQATLVAVLKKKKQIQDAKFETQKDAKGEKQMTKQTKHSSICTGFASLPNNKTNKAFKHLHGFRTCATLGECSGDDELGYSGPAQLLYICGPVSSL